MTDIIISHINARSLANEEKLLTLLRHILQEQISIFAVTVTWKVKKLVDSKGFLF